LSSCFIFNIYMLFTGMVGPYREIFLEVLKTARGHLEKYFSIRTSNPVNNIYIFPDTIDCERSLLSAGLDFRAWEWKGGTADNTSRNETALPTQRKIPIGRNRYACQSNLICSNYAILNDFQSECWFYTGCVKIKVIERQRAIVSELLRMNEIFSSSERSGLSSSCQMDKK
jgi:hypothetical protein